MTRITSIREPSSSPDRRVVLLQFGRFICVGILNTLFGQAVFVCLVLADLHHQLALPIATILGVVFNFYTTGTLVFHNRDRRLLTKFVICYVVAYMVNAVALGMLVSEGIAPITGQTLLLVPMAILVFAINRQYVFVVR